MKTTEQKSNSATFSKVVSLERAKAMKGGLTHHVIKNGPKKGIAFFVFGDNDSAYISKKAKELIDEEGKAAIALLSFGIVEYVDEQTGELRTTPTVFPTPEDWLTKHSIAEEW